MSKTYGKFSYCIHLVFVYIIPHFCFIKASFLMLFRMVGYSSSFASALHLGIYVWQMALKRLMHIH